MTEQAGPISPDRESTQRAWARYWRSGALHSCATSFAANYDGAIASFWRGVFATLAAGDRVLDIATGNGAIAKILIEVADPTITCEAVDIAPVAPSWPSTLPASEQRRLRFHGRTAAESLPFPPAQFALAVSQFGLEYTDLARSIPEVLRVLRRPSQVALVVHHARSRLVEMAVEERRHIGWLLQSAGLFECTLQILHLMARATTARGRAELAGDAAAVSARENFNRWQRELSARAETSACPDLLFEIRDAIAMAAQTATRQGEAAATTQMAAVRQALADNGLRLDDLCQAAVDEAGLQALLSRFDGARQASVEPLRQADHLVGWSVRLELG